MLDIRPNILEKSSNTKRLETIAALEALLAQVPQAVAMRKFMELVEDKIPDAGKYQAQTKSKGAWRCYVRKPSYSWEKHACVFFFGPIGEAYRAEAPASIELELEHRDIPSLREALAKYKEKVARWEAEEIDNTTIYSGQMTREIELSLSSPLTRAQFNKKRADWIELLRTAANELEASC